jgi:uncharacterized protein (TIGR02271 family)
LQNAGFDREQISIVAQGSDYEQYADADGRLTYEDDGVGDGAGTGATVGAVGGGIIGLLAGLGGLLIPGIGPIVAAGPLVGALAGAGVGAVAGGLVGALVDLGVPEDDAEYYAEGIRRGGTLVTVRAADERADEAADIMNRYNPIDLDRRVESWRGEGWTGYDADAPFYDADQLATERERYADRATNYVHDRDYSRDVDVDVDRTYDRGFATDVDVDLDRDVEGREVLPVVEEEMRVGKRAVRRGGVRVTSHVEEVPVEEQVTLREERVNVERRPVDRELRAGELDDMGLREGTIEVTETAEEAVVDKRARVTEEVVVSKDVDTRTETIRDTVRHTDVDVQQLDTGTRASDIEFGDWEGYESSFRNDFDTHYASRGFTWDEYRPAYQYGYQLGTNPSYRGRQWSEIEPEARRTWEGRNQGAWEDFKDAVQRAWNNTKDAVS